MKSLSLAFVVLGGLLLGGCSMGLQGVGAGTSPAGDAAGCVALTAQLGHPLQVHETQRFLLLTAADDGAAAATGRFLDQVYQRFHDEFTRAGFALQPPPGRLICVSFDSYDALDAYGRQADQTAVGWMDAYYSQLTNRIAVVRSGGRGAKLAVGQPSFSSGRLAAYGAPVAGPADSGGLNLRTITHELAHQLAFNSGVQRRGADYPFWLTEGLATNFEADASGVFGFGAKEPCHRCRLLDAKAGGRTIPLERFLGLTESPTGSPLIIRDAYAEAWGLFHFLFQQRRAELRQYMAALSSSWGSQDAQSLRRGFVAAFGPIQPLEREFQRFIDGLGAAATNAR